MIRSFVTDQCCELYPLERMDKVQEQDEERDRAYRRPSTLRLEDRSLARGVGQLAAGLTCGAKLDEIPLVVD